MAKWPDIDYKGVRRVGSADTDWTATAESTFLCGCTKYKQARGATADAAKEAARKKLNVEHNRHRDSGLATGHWRKPKKK